MKKQNKIIDRTFWVYVGLGLLNYGICNVVMLVLYNVFDVETTTSLIIEFAMQTGISFLLNRFVTFRGLELTRWWPVKFVITVGVCYFVAKVLLYQVFDYLIELPFFTAVAEWVRGILAKNADPALFRHNLVMLACTFAYCVINYFGQRYYVFRPRNSEKAE